MKQRGTEKMARTHHPCCQENSGDGELSGRNRCPGDGRNAGPWLREMNIRKVTLKSSLSHRTCIQQTQNPTNCRGSSSEFIQTLAISHPTTNTICLLVWQQSLFLSPSYGYRNSVEVQSSLFDIRLHRRDKL